MLRLFLFLPVILSMSVTTVAAQAVAANDSLPHADTSIFVPPDDADIKLQVSSHIDTEEHLTQNPTAALFKSMLVPGLGQIGNRSYFKAGLFIGLETWFALSAIDRGRDAGRFRDRFEAATDPETRNRLYAEYEMRRDDRNKYLWFFGITTFVSMFDAFVDAHLSGAPDRVAKRGIDLSIAPDLQGGAQAMLALRF